MRVECTNSSTPNCSITFLQGRRPIIHVRKVYSFKGIQVYPSHLILFTVILGNHAKVRHKAWLLEIEYVKCLYENTMHSEPLEMYFSCFLWSLLSHLPSLSHVHVVVIKRTGHKAELRQHWTFIGLKWNRKYRLQMLNTMSVQRSLSYSCADSSPEQSAGSMSLPFCLWDLKGLQAGLECVKWVS